jgi:hypothetical protein
MRAGEASAFDSIMSATVITYVKEATAGSLGATSSDPGIMEVGKSLSFDSVCDPTMTTGKAQFSVLELELEVYRLSGQRQVQ